MARKKVDIKDKKLFLAFVYLSDDEYAQLCEKLGKEAADDWIQQLNNYLGLSEKNRRKYESHYYAILVWSKPRERPRPRRTTPDRPRSTALWSC